MKNRHVFVITGILEAAYKANNIKISFFNSEKLEEREDEIDLDDEDDDEEDLLIEMTPLELEKYTEVSRNQISQVIKHPDFPKSALRRDGRKLLICVSKFFLFVFKYRREFPEVATSLNDYLTSGDKNEQ